MCGMVGSISQSKNKTHLYMQIWTAEIAVGGLVDIIVSYEVGGVKWGW